MTGRGGLSPPEFRGDCAVPRVRWSQSPSKPGWLKSTFDTLKADPALGRAEALRHGGRPLTGLISRIARRLLALSAAILQNWHTNNPGRHLTAYDH